MLKREIVKRRLKDILNISEAEVIFARNCTVGKIDAKSARNFVDKFHLQGYSGSTVKLGTFHNDELVSVMTFRKLNIAKGSKSEINTYELDRFCSNYNFRVVGVASKLLKYFINNYNPIKIISYADRRWSDGNLYKRLGFNFVHNTDPNYWYFSLKNPYNLIHRFNFRKSVLNKKLETFDPNKTEVENMNENDYYRIFDCGNMKFELII